MVEQNELAKYKSLESKFSDFQFVVPDFEIQNAENLTT
jgi:hypothetical protein